MNNNQRSPKVIRGQFAYLVRYVYIVYNIKLNFTSIGWKITKGHQRSPKVIRGQFAYLVRHLFIIYTKITNFTSMCWNIIKGHQMSLKVTLIIWSDVYTYPVKCCQQHMLRCLCVLPVLWVAITPLFFQVKTPGALSCNPDIKSGV